MIIVKKETDIHVTEGELRRYRQEYTDFCRFHVNPPSLEEFIRSQQKSKKIFQND